ncbi:hypothetical protein CVT24_006864 [Panaeolus cyanescens]|uniref:Smr domain-containing protein n=1 Tax=Panaeolus cyanescens TaxID=181874 RepID=A0A409W061_9AGAR|nr:hypothetical protein CVT24_006864 [Panaeolus cyanescens]
MPVSEQSLFDSLIKDFSPTLDSSLIAALLAEIERDEHGKPSQPTQSNIDQLRQTLSELALQADETQLSEFSDYQLTSPFEETVSSWTTPDTATNDRSGTSGSSVDSNSIDGLNSPLGFLQAALPGLSPERLTQALAEHENSEIDLWDVVACILSEESIRELEERGLDGLEEDDESDFTIPPEIEWEFVEPKKRNTKKPPQSTKKKQKPTKIALADVRQQHHVRVTYPSTAPNKTANDSPALADPWTQLSSLSSHLSTLLPPHPPSTFLSYFHSPSHSTSYDALRSALQSICKEPLQGLRSDEHTTILFTLLDIILPEYESSDDQHRARVIQDIELAVLATEGRGDEALDLVNLLRELDSSSDLGIQHVSPKSPIDASTEVIPPASSSLAKFNTTSRPHTNSISKLPDGPPPVPPPPPSKVKPKPPGSSGNRPSPFQWQAVQSRKPAQKAPQRISHHVPTYNKNVNGVKVDRSGTKGAWGTAVSGTVVGGAKSTADADADEFRRRVGETMKRRDEALREASRMWRKGGGAKMRGGEIAFYFAEQARQLQEVARQEALNAARAMVAAKRQVSPLKNLQRSENHDTIDLHGTTVAEAITIVREILAEDGAVSRTKPMKIITGRGSHSVNNVSVLKPAIKKALMEDGWSVAMWDAGLVVRK